MFVDRLNLYLSDVDLALSRTAKSAKVATAVSAEKLPALLEGEPLRRALEKNRQNVAEWIAWRRRTLPNGAPDVVSAILTLAGLANAGITAGPTFRSWPYLAQTDLSSIDRSSIDSAHVWAELCVLAAQVSSTFNEDSERRKHIAGYEWEIGIGPLHPFYDGCGRVSRYFATLLSLWSNETLPTHASRAEYMNAATLGKSAFQAYWTSCPEVRWDAW